jgi:type II secretory pathway pseudopilin PulG
MKLRRLRDQQAGFSLIELLIYITIFSTMIGAVVGLAVLASGQKANSQATADINYQGEATMALITQTVHQANAITVPAAGATGASLSLTMPNASVNPSVFTSNNDGTTNRLQMSEGSPAVNSNLTNSHVTVSNLTFTNMSLPSTKGSVLISFTITYRTSSARQEFSVSKRFMGAATIP